MIEEEPFPEEECEPNPSNQLPECQQDGPVVVGEQCEALEVETVEVVSWEVLLVEVVSWQYC